MTKEVIAQKVKDIIVDRLSVNPAEVTEASEFTNDLGADSLDTVELVMEFEKQFDIKIEDTEAEKVTTVGKAIECIENILNKKA